MKRLKFLLIIGVTAAVVLLLARSSIASFVISTTVRAVTGLRVQVGSLHLGLFQPDIQVTNLKVFNPPEFQDQIMIDLPGLFIHYDRMALLMGKVHLREVRLHLAEFLVEKNSQGVLNIDSLKFVQSKKKEKTVPTKQATSDRVSFEIDLLELKIGRAVYKDYSITPALVQEFVLNLDERYERIQNPTILGSLILSQVLLHTAIGKLTHFDVGLLMGDLQGIAHGAASFGIHLAGRATQTGMDSGKKAGKMTQETAGKTVDILRKFLPTEKQ